MCVALCSVSVNHCWSMRRYTTVFGLDDTSAADPRTRAVDFERKPRRIPETLQARGYDMVAWQRPRWGTL